MTGTHVGIHLPCSAVQLENAVPKAAQNGHWHDAQEGQGEGNSLTVAHLHDAF